MIKYRPPISSNLFVQPIEISFNGKLDFSDYEFGEMYVTVIKNAVKEKGPNFAGHYFFVYWGCGSPCKLSAVVDLRTGKVYNGIPSGTGYAFQKDSRLLIVNPPDSSNWYDITVPYSIPAEYEWVGTKFKKIRF